LRKTKGVLYLSNRFFTRKILLVRHGLTDWNYASRFQGRTDVPLNKEGMAQAEKVARRVEGWPVDAVYSSPLTRARQTADIIAARLHKSATIIDDLVEVNFGMWEGLYFKELMEKKRRINAEMAGRPFFLRTTGRGRLELHQTACRTGYDFRT
jgi:broad specificity phosphatase PhoE